MFRQLVKFVKRGTLVALALLSAALLAVNSAAALEVPVVFVQRTIKAKPSATTRTSAVEKAQDGVLAVLGTDELFDYLDKYNPTLQPTPSPLMTLLMPY